VNPLLKIIACGLVFASAGLVSALTAAPVSYVALSFSLTFGVFMLRAIQHFRDDYS
jgi:hypothetical protein